MDGGDGVGAPDSQPVGGFNIVFPEKRQVQQFDELRTPFQGVPLPKLN